MIDLDVSERVCDDLIGHGLGYLPPAGIGNSVSIKEIIARLRQAEKDAARYKNEVEAAKFDIGNLSSKLERADSVIFEVERVLSERQKNGFFECDDLLSEAQYYINNHQGVKE